MWLRNGFVVAAYVVMPQHVHLLVSEPKKALLSKAIQALKLSVSVQSRHRPFWQARYYDLNGPGNGTIQANWFLSNTEVSGSRTY
jgi:putative transposase